MISTRRCSPLQGGRPKLHFKRLVQIVKPDGSVRVFMVDDELNIYTVREMRLLAEKHFGKVPNLRGRARAEAQRPAVLAGGGEIMQF
ncbi:Methyltransferase C-terminus, putative [Thermococcus gammatolerans EJ3]|uniref:Methyltransferase C-terminus, putative n=1 Tax=Thermococcus gammatolerans (strain DSM 15229 / JCM 11827 / EJ3) TaxID=593117 RepID=C5A4M8_THEGJ|nr:Methyltransferase C-terminus, putative [Thermococcus gammatolerans EJ3]